MTDGKPREKPPAQGAAGPGPGLFGSGGNAAPANAKSPANRAEGAQRFGVSPRAPPRAQGLTAAHTDARRGLINRLIKHLPVITQYGLVATEVLRLWYSNAVTRGEDGRVREAIFTARQNRVRTRTMLRTLRELISHRTFFSV